MADFFKFVDLLEQESEQELFVLDFNGNYKYGNRYKIFCGVEGCEYNLTWQVVIEFKNDMNFYMKLEPQKTDRDKHDHNTGGK